MITLLLTTFAVAGTYTDVPGAKQGDISLSNSFLSTRDTLYQEDISVGSRTQYKNTINVYGSYGIFDFMTAEVFLPFGFQGLSFSDFNQMEFDPLSEMGTYLDTNPAEDYSLSGSGVEGITLALNFYPFHSKIFSSRGDSGNWKLGVVYRTPDNTHFFSPSPKGKRGSGVGAQGFGVQTSFSNRIQKAEPYLLMSAIKSGRWTGPIRNNSGETLVDAADFFPSSTVDVQAGSEIFLFEDIAFATYVTLDLFGKYRYSGWQNIPSGIFLPNVLETTKDEIITQTEVVSFQGGLGTNVQINSLYAFQINGTVGYASPQRIEHIYEISTLGSFQWGVGGSFTFRYRTTSS